MAARQSSQRLSPPWTWLRYRASSCPWQTGPSSEHRVPFGGFGPAAPTAARTWRVDLDFAGVAFQALGTKPLRRLPVPRPSDSRLRSPRCASIPAPNAASSQSLRVVVSLPRYEQPPRSPMDYIRVDRFRVFSDHLIWDPRNEDDRGGVRWESRA